ncbi:RecQ family ATP-dependent DNA helicase [Niabella drilacis]|uniref:ATP-dependent DNA helicase RecQ n=1 Tax=Niabella drilacis (strain DSM 25811 / CCM 8410 / CCUG 62505 / LMG 26954 / E90) TaxID=1285928 RepID=A0A1G6NCV6_NIADE|nr:ATP-dependent DNA helicase RecQ [Niabella drilacis]SDC65592.1 ATP-dependent DNA helicase RecQ [Niabella drilacis]
MEQALREILKEYFGYDHFRPLQSEIVQAAVKGKDVLALMPTGGGKSLCYQVPGLYKEGLCLVISPLIALMNDQVQNLRKKNITAFAIHTGMSRKEVIHVLKTAAHSNCKFLYVSPERLETNLFKEYLPALGVNLIAVDEAHCISQWGYDFRPPYLRIARLREELPGIPVIALTASATPKVQEDICEKLSPEGQNTFTVFRQSFERPNLSYSVFKVASRIRKITEVLGNVPGTAIIYCKTRKHTKELRDLLLMEGIAADYYNAGLPAEERTRKQQDWIRNKTRVIVCTNAFGMGIDKPDVRVVIHADVPDCLENYYQEAGRAGRDGTKSYAVLLYSDAELEALEKMPEQRFPDMETIRRVYGSVVHYLQLPENEPPGEFYDFDLKDFIKKFGLDVTTAVYSLKALEQDGWLTFNEQVFIPATVRFTVYKETLYEYEGTHADSEPLVKTLLRTYEGIYDYPIGISESYIAYLMKTDASLIREQLLRLDADGIIDYQPRKEDPQLMLTRTRVRIAELQINMKNYTARKRLFTERIAQMKRYVTDETGCRSKMIGNYFGDHQIKDCGVCDNCLKRRNNQLTREAFETIQSRIRETLTEPSTIPQLMTRLQGAEKEHIWTVINFLTREEKIQMLEDGTIRWKQ